MQKLLIAVFITIVSITPNLRANQQGETSMNMNQPYVVLDVDFAGCSYVPAINGVTFSDMWGGDSGVLATKMPINQWLKSGSNDFTLILKPAKDVEKVKQLGQDCEATVKLQVKPANASNDEYQTIATYQYHSPADDLTTDADHFQGTTKAGQLDSSHDFRRVDEGGDVKIGPMHVESIQTENGPGVKMTREVDIPLPFPKWAWFDGEKISDNDQTKQELFKKYKQIWKALHTQDFSHIEDWFNQRDAEISQAFYLDDKKTTIPDMKKEAANPSAELGGPLKPEYVHVVHKADDRLAALVANTDGEGCIFFNNKKTDMNSTYDIWFMKKNGEWKLIR